MNKVFINKQDIIEAVLAGKQTRESIVSAIHEIIETSHHFISQDKRVLLLVDLSEFNNVPLGAPSAAISAGRSINFDKVAYIGASSTVKQVLKFIIATVGDTVDTKIFDTREDAVTWLTES